MINTKNDFENRTLLGSYIQFDMFTNNSEIYKKNVQKCNLNAIHLEMESYDKENKKKDSMELPEKAKCQYQIYISIKVTIGRVVMKIPYLL